MNGVFLSDRERDDDGNLTMTVTVAREGAMMIDPLTGARYIELLDGYRYSGYPGELDYEVARFDKFGELIEEVEGGVRTADPVDGRSTRKLLDSDLPEDKAALQWRIAIPVMVPIVAIIAMCLSRTDHRRGRYIKMAPAFLIYLAYLMLLANARTAMAEGDALPGGMWGIHLLFLCGALLMLYGGALRQRLSYRRRSSERT